MQDVRSKGNLTSPLPEDSRQDVRSEVIKGQRRSPKAHHTLGSPLPEDSRQDVRRKDNLTSPPPEGSRQDVRGGDSPFPEGSRQDVRNGVRPDTVRAPRPPGGKDVAV